MGCDIHSVLQKKDKKGKFVTIDTDIIAGRDYDLFSWLSGVRGSDEGIMIPGLPDDFGVDKDNKHQDYWLGEHNFGHITLDEFCEAEVNEPPQLGDRFTMEHHSNGYTVTFLENDECLDEHQSARELQSAFKRLYGMTFSFTDENGDTEVSGVGAYRLIVGYDS